MIFLITKIFVYLLMAGIVGGAAGWLFRNLQAQRTEESASRAVNDAKSKLPQLESLLRGRDEQITKLKGQLQEGQAQLSEREQELRANEQQFREQQRVTKRLEQSNETVLFEDGEDFDIAAGDAANSNNHDTDNQDTDKLIAELSQEIARLKAQLEQADAQTNVAASGDETLVQVEMEALRAQLQTAENKLRVATADLLHEQNKVLELEGERELQNKSLQVLHQQLELERTRRLAANG